MSIKEIGEYQRILDEYNRYCFNRQYDPCAFICKKLTEYISAGRYGFIDLFLLEVVQQNYYDLKDVLVGLLYHTRDKYKNYKQLFTI